MKEKFKYLGKNTIIFAIASFGTKFLAFFLVPLYTSVLSTAEYGTADIITTTATLLMYVFTINISASVLRFTIERKEKQSEILNYGVKVISVGSLCVIGVLILLWWSELLNWENYYYFFAFGYFLFTALYELYGNYMRAMDKVRDVAVGGVISSATMMLSNIVFLIIIRIGIIGYLISLVAGPLIGTFYLIYCSKVPLREYLSKGCDAITRREMRAYCIPLIFNNIALWINAFLDRYFVTAMCGVDQNGIYSVASKIPNILAIFYTVFSQAWNLSAIKEFDSEDKDGFFSSTYRYLNVLTVMVCSGLILINVPLARILFSNDFFVAWQYSSVLLISVMFNSLTAFQGGIFGAAKQSKVVAYTTIISAVLNIILNILLISTIGVLGAAIATVVSYGIMWAIRMVILRNLVNLRLTIWKDLIAYGLLSLQIVAEHMDGHLYIVQVIIQIFLIKLYTSELTRVMQVIIRRGKR